MVFQVGFVLLTAEAGQIDHFKGREPQLPYSFLQHEEKANYKAPGGGDWVESVPRMLILRKELITNAEVPILSFCFLTFSSYTAKV